MKAKRANRKKREEAGDWNSERTSHGEGRRQVGKRTKEGARETR